MTAQLTLCQSAPRTNTDLMKKGLRLRQDLRQHGRVKGNEHRPDEKGIATIGKAVFAEHFLKNEHRPDEKGIATPSKGRRGENRDERTQT